MRSLGYSPRVGARMVCQPGGDNGALAVGKVAARKVATDHKTKRRVAIKTRLPIDETRLDTRFVASGDAISAVKNLSLKQRDRLTKAIGENVGNQFPEHVTLN